VPSAERVYPAVKLPLLAGGDAAAFFPFATTGEDNLRVTTFGYVGGSAVEISGRIRQPDGTMTTFTHTSPASANGLARAVEFPLGAGVLLNLTLHTTGEELLFGHCFAIVQLIRGFTGATAVMATLLQGYVTGTQHLAWPGSPIKHTREFDGLMQFGFPANPAAGAPLQLVVLPGVIWRPVSVKMRFTASAAVANRQVFVQYFNALLANELSRVAAPFLVTAGQDVVTTFGDGAFVDNATMGLSLHTQGLPALELSQGFVLQVTAALLQAGDQIQDVVIGVRQWLEGRT